MSNNEKNKAYAHIHTYLGLGFQYTKVDKTCTLVNAMRNAL